MAWTSLLVKALSLGAIVLAIQALVTYLRSPLKNIPGPFLARFSNVWRLLDHYNQTHIETQRKLHKKHGDFVRLGPNTVSIADASLLRTIYSTRGTFKKSDYYSVNDALQNGHLIQNLFSTRSNEFHSRGLKPIQKLYTLQSSLQYESVMDGDFHVLGSELERRYMDGDCSGKTCDIADWVSYFVWDLLGDMTWSSRMGFMESGKDVGGMIATAESVMRYFSVVGQIPALDKFLGKNPYMAKLYKFDDFSVAAGAAVERFMDRMQNLEQLKDKKDLVNGYLEAKREYPNIVGDNEIIGYMILNILGGADTLAIVLKSIIYYILKSPSVKAKLVEELRAASLSFPSSYQSLVGLPYLDACIKEGLRIHPVLGHIAERVVPASGLTLPDGTVLPPGTIVGINAWVLHFKEEIFGPNTDQFIPERWLQGEHENHDAYTARMKKMKDADMSFGNGNRTCLGRPLATIQLFKTIAFAFGKYEINLEDPSQDWELQKQWFVWPHKILVKMSPFEKV